jgi:4-hydroxybenzoate polyprenyltransferase
LQGKGDGVSLPYLIYKRVRTGLGLTFGFILMYGAITTNLGLPLLLIATGFFLIHLFGDMYNDYCDYHEDVRNQRKDKLTVNKVITPACMRNASFLILITGLLLLLNMTFGLFLAGVYYAFIFFAYSNHAIRLKKYHYKYYFFAAATVWTIVIISTNIFFAESFGPITGILIAFCSSQFFYISCQKDSTDRKDDTNLFLANKWSFAWAICMASSVVALLSLAGLTNSVLLIIPLMLNMAAKGINLIKIRDMTITRSLRGRIVLVEFLTPFLYTITRLLM